MKLHLRAGGGDRDEHIVGATDPRYAWRQAQKAVLAADELYFRRSQHDRHSISATLPIIIIATVSWIRGDARQSGIEQDRHSHHRVGGGRAVGNAQDERLERLSLRHDL